MLGVAVLVLAVFAIRQQHDRGASAGSPTGTVTQVVTAPPSAPAGSTATSPPSTPTTPTTPAAAKAPLVVLNNSTIRGLAKSASERFEAGGWTVTTYDNYQNTIVSTCAYYDPDVAGAQAAALALQQQFPTIKRVEAQFAQLAVWHSPIVVILTSDYAQ